MGTGLAVFFAVTIPIVVYGYLKPGGFEDYWVLLGIGLGAICGLGVGLLIDARERAARAKPGSSDHRG